MIWIILKNCQVHLLTTAKFQPNAHFLQPKLLLVRKHILERQPSDKKKDVQALLLWEWSPKTDHTAERNRDQ